MTELLGDPQMHFWLTRSVARVMGVNLSEAMARDELTAQRYAQLVTDCRSCKLVQSCQHWLAARSDTTTSAPPGCANTKVLESLARRH